MSTVTGLELSWLTMTICTWSAFVGPLPITVNLFELDEPGMYQTSSDTVALLVLSTQISATCMNGLVDAAFTATAMLTSYPIWVTVNTDDGNTLPAVMTLPVIWFISDAPVSRGTPVAAIWSAVATWGCQSGASERTLIPPRPQRIASRRPNSQIPGL